MLLQQTILTFELKRKHISQINFNVYQETLNTCAVFGEAKWKLFYA